MIPRSSHFQPPHERLGKDLVAAVFAESSVIMLVPAALRLRRVMDLCRREGGCPLIGGPVWPSAQDLGILAMAAIDADGNDGSDGEDVIHDGPDDVEDDVDDEEVLGNADLVWSESDILPLPTRTIRGNERVVPEPLPHFNGERFMGPNGKLLREAGCSKPLEFLYLFITTSS